MPRVKVLILTASYPVGPYESFLGEEIRALAKHRVELVVVPLWPRGTYPAESHFLRDDVHFAVTGLLSLPIFLAAMRMLRVKSYLIAGWIRTLFLSQPLGTFMKSLAVLPKALWLADFSCRTGVTHIHAHWASRTSTCGMIAASLAGLSWSFTAHRWDIYENDLLAFKADNASFVRFISNRGFADAMKLGVEAKSGRVIHMGVNLSPLASRRPINCQNGKLRIITAANLIPVKGHRFLLEAVHLLSLGGIDATLTVAGQGPLLGELQDLAQLMNIGQSVTFAGHVAHDALLTSYMEGKYDVFVLPSVDLGSGEHEGIPVSLMEAMAHGIPVVATQTGSIEELLPRQLGATVPAENPSALAEVLKRLALDPSHRSQFTQSQTELIRRWSSDNSAKQLLSMISEHVKHRHLL